MDSINKGFCVLICALGCTMVFGCGSESNRGAPPSAKNQKSSTGNKASALERGGSQVMGLLNSNKVTEVNGAPVNVRPRVEEDPNVEVIPPSKPGGKGVTQAELDAAIAAQPKPERIEVIPPSKPGGRGLTQKELDAAIAAQPKPERIEVVPPSVPGGQGLTQEELDKILKNQPTAEPEVIPPPVPGGRGLTEKELEAAAPPPPSPEDIPPPK